MTFLLFLGGSVVLFAIAALLSAPALLRPSRVARRLLAVVENNRVDQRAIGRKERYRNRILAMAMSLRGWLRISEDTRLSLRLSSAGFKNSAYPTAYAAVRVLCPLLALVIASFVHDNTVFWMFASAVVGYMIPDFWLERMIKRRRERIRKGIPDAIDLLVICVGAGLGLDQALQRVGQELSTSHVDIHDELLQINLEQRAGKPRLDAWKSMAQRTKIEEFDAFVSMLAQTDRFGTPIIRALSRFSEDVRLKRRQRAEEMAAKTKVKILFPLVLFIFPCIFIVLLAPAVLHMAAAMHTVSR